MHKWYLSLLSHSYSSFEILGQMANTSINGFNFGYPFVNGERKYARVLVRHLKS